MLLSSRSATLWLIGGSTLLRLLWAALLEPMNDEAYHWQYTRHPAWSYFDHPPMLMGLGQLGLTICGGWVHAFSLRLGFVLLMAGSMEVLFRWTSRWFGERAGFWATAGLALTHYYTAFGGTFALPDSPLLFFTLFTYWQCGEAIFGPKGASEISSLSGQHLRSWALVGLGFGGALLSKYHGILLPGGVVLYALVTSGARRWLWSPGPYLAVVIGLMMFTPVIVWNAEHEWASFRFQGGRATGSDRFLFHEGPLKWLLGPVLFLLPWIWFWLMVGFLPRLLRFRSLQGVKRLLICLAVVPLGFFLFTSCLHSQALPHWPLIGFLPMYPLLGRVWVQLAERRRRLFQGLVVSWIMGEVLILLAIFLQAHQGWISLPPSVVDETRQFSGWSSVAQELDQRGYLAEPNGFLITNNWENSGQLAFAIRERIPVACYHSFDARGFAFWSKPEDYLGRTGYLLIVDEDREDLTLSEFSPYFLHMSVVCEFPMTRSGRPFRRVKVYRCEQQLKPYPFDFRVRAP